MRKKLESKADENSQLKTRKIFEKDCHQWNEMGYPSKQANILPKPTIKKAEKSFKFA